MRFVLISVAHASLAICDDLATTDEGKPLTAAEVKQLVSVAVNFTLTSAALLEYVRFLTGRPCEN